MGSRPTVADGADGDGDAGSPGPGQYEVERRGAAGPAFTMARRSLTTGKITLEHIVITHMFSGAA